MSDPNQITKIIGSSLQMDLNYPRDMVGNLLNKRVPVVRAPEKLTSLATNDERTTTLTIVELLHADIT